MEGLTLACSVRSSRLLVFTLIRTEALSTNHGLLHTGCESCKNLRPASYSVHLVHIYIGQSEYAERGAGHTLRWNTCHEDDTPVGAA